MIISRNIGVLRHPLHRILVSQSHVARLSTSRVFMKKLSDTVEVPTAAESQPYPFMSRYNDAKYDTTEAFQPRNQEKWKHQTNVFLLCYMVTLVYWLLLREEHGTDESIGNMFYEVMPDMEKEDLKKKIKMYKKYELYYGHLEERLAELEKKKR